MTYEVKEPSAKYLAKVGYKRTDLGEIPGDWDVTALGDISIISSGGTPSRTRADYWNGDIPWITTSEVDFSRIEFAEQFISNEGLQNSAAKFLPPGTILLALYGQGKTRGKVGVLGIEAATNQACASIEIKRDVSPDFLLHFLTSRYDAIRAMSNGGSQDNLNSGIVKSILVPVPLSAEQRAIATALSDVDALIAGLEKLIAKKRDLKQAAMQQLLTGQTRLPGFSGAWVSRSLGSLGTIYGGLVGKSKADFGHGSASYVPFVNVMANVRIDCGALEPVNVASTENQNRVLFGDLLFNGSSETPEEVALCGLMTQTVENLYLNSFCFGFRFNQGVEASGLFLTYLMRSQMGRELMKSLAQGSTRYNLSKSALLQATLVLPSLEEQTAIATVLSDMDTNLVTIKARLAKSREFKQGMMQELLTGRTRLV